MLKPEEIEREVLYVYACCEQVLHFSPQVPADKLIRDFVDLSKNTKPLKPGEKGVVSLIDPKTAALLGNRVWLQFAGADTRLDFAFGWSTPMDVRLATLLLCAKEGLLDEGVSGNDRVELADSGKKFVTFSEGELVQTYASVLGAHLIPIYKTTKDRQRDFKPGEHTVIITVLQDIALVDEYSLTWEQVLEFRSDKDTRIAYQRFAHWLDKEVVGKSAAYVVDEVSQRLERYEWAVRKHGIKTVTGTLERTLDARSVIGSAAMTTAIEVVLHSPLLSLLSGAGLMVGKAAITAAAYMIERKNLEMEHRDISFVHEIKKRIK